MRAGVPLYLLIKHHGTPHYICCAMMWVYYRAIPTEIGFDFALLQLPALHDLGQQISLGCTKGPYSWKCSQECGLLLQDRNTDLIFSFTVTPNQDNSLSCILHHIPIIQFLCKGKLQGTKLNTVSHQSIQTQASKHKHHPL